MYQSILSPLASVSLPSLLSLPTPLSFYLHLYVSLVPSLPSLFLPLSPPSLHSLSYECLSAKPHYTAAFYLESERSSPIITKNDQSIVSIPLVLLLTPLSSFFF